MKPQKLEDMILPSRIKNLLISLDHNNIQNMLFSGLHGMGKSLSCYLLSKKLGMPTINVDLSDKDKRGVSLIEDLPSKIERKTNKRKLIIINEIDNIGSSQSMALLKNLIDQYACEQNNKAVFLFTTNHPNKVQNPVSESRCLHINFNLTNDEKKEVFIQAQNYCKNYIETNNITYDDNVKKSVIDLLKSTLPDYRSMSKFLETGVDVHKKTENSNLTFNFSNITPPSVVSTHMNLYYKEKNFSGFVTWYKSNVTTDFKSSIMNFVEQQHDNNNLPEIYYYASEYIHRIDTGLTPHIHLLAFMASIIKVG